MRIRSLMRRTLATVMVLVSCTAGAWDLPDPRLTPGVINPGVTQNNIQQTICVKGWTKTVCPPVYFTNKLKKIQLREYGYTVRNPKHFEENHLVPIGLGGAPNNARKLWPERLNSEWNADKKDALEFALYKRVGAGQMPLAETQEIIRANGIEAYRKYAGWGGRRGGRASHGRAD